jgi:hypothetical protein
MSLRMITLGTSTSDSGANPIGNTFYAIDGNQVLRWYQYLGKGEDNPAPGNTKWHANSGNPIGNGWGVFKWLQLGTGGTLLAIRNDGNLYRYRYNGHGESDVSGQLGWEPGSSTVIGNGWQNFSHVLMYYNSGGDFQLIAVETSGDMRSYAYHHTDGWLPGTGQVIGAGWTGFKHLIGTTSVIFGVKPSGDLAWYKFVPVAPGTPGPWVLEPNSGNVIGNGWQTFTHLVVGGYDNPPATSPTLCGVDARGNMRWYHYHGAGESDPSGALGWSLNSGNIITSSW